MEKINNFDLALRAEHSHDRPFEKRLFGQFKANGVLGAEVTLAFEAGRYAYVGSPLHLQLWTPDGLPVSIWEPYVTLTANIRPNDCKSDEIIVKTYEENAHLRTSLLALGYFEDTGRRIQSGFASLEIWRLTEKFVEAFNTAHPQMEAA